jgi:osmotically inducible protein OsmC
MPQFSRHTTTNWTGSLMEGKGEVHAGTKAFTLPVSFPRRIGEAEGTTSPEELIAAAHGACYAMVVAGMIGRTGAKVANHTVTCTVTADKTDAGIKIMTSRLDLVVEGLEGVSGDAFTTAAKEAKDKCPVSGALAGSLQIEVHVTFK